MAHEQQQHKEEESPGGIPHKVESSTCTKSHIQYLKSTNMAGTQESHQVWFTKDGLWAVTGETGSGKSLLVAKVANLIKGGKATTITSHNNNRKEDNKTITVEMMIHLQEPHKSWVSQMLAQYSIPNNKDENNKLHLKRTLAQGSNFSSRMTSTCEINGQVTTLKALKAIVSPLIAVVDAPSAAQALAKQSSRMSVIDGAVETDMKQHAKQAQSTYHKYKRRRQQLQRELENRVVSRLRDDSSGDDDNETLQHWIKELDVFQKRMEEHLSLCIGDDELGDEENTSHEFNKALHSLKHSSWLDDDNGSSSSSVLYQHLVEFRDALKNLETEMESANEAMDALKSNGQDSAWTALQRARQCLYQASSSSSTNDAAEPCHELLNQVEEAVKKSVASIEYHLVNKFENLRSYFPKSLEDVDGWIGDWNQLARKHGVSPYALPSCHLALKQELSGNVEAQQELPHALEKEKQALVEYQQACKLLGQARIKVSKRLSSKVSSQLSALGMSGSTFEAKLKPANYDKNSFEDTLDFLLLHDSDQQRGGRLETVASAGEKARILLAIETELPGSIGACQAMDQSSSSDSSSNDSPPPPPPIVVLYDEIDAHVGGRAAVLMADMLWQQAQQQQTISITHSPCLAAIANSHLMVSTDGILSISGTTRRRELARMASGDLAADEAQVFADALLRDGAKTRNETITAATTTR